ncbi:hypothetical protein [Shewanella indica]|uniref:hypothetical protein n=1 Tax=Shewanella indica TaxID=768528 RepID=UPI001CFEC7B9|nr:hypothetical protein [Shewanella indica]
MLNPAMFPVMAMLGAIAANLTELVRGENSRWQPAMEIGVRTFSLAIAAYTVLWFALLTAAVYAGGDADVMAGVEVLGTFQVGMGIYSLFHLSRFISSKLQLWIYRLALPLVIGGSFLVSKFG